jgi:hypothetical protein
MCSFIRPDTVHILGGTQQTGHQHEYQADSQSQPESQPTWWSKFKAKVKHVWHKVMTIAADVKENIMPIVTGVGSFLVGWATFCNRTRNSDRQWGTPA